MCQPEGKYLLWYYQKHDKSYREIGNWRPPHNAVWGETMVHLRSNILPGRLPRNQGVTCCRMITDHDYLWAHLHRIRVADDPTSVLCKGKPMTIKNILTITKKRKKINRIWHCLSVNVGIERMVKGRRKRWQRKS